MQKSRRIQRSFFDLIYDHSVPANHFLRTLNESIDWTRFERHVEHLNSSGKGRPAHNALLMTKTLILQFLYDLSDRQLEEQIQDRISFRFFLGVDPADPIPDHTAYCRFRDRLGAETIAHLFNEVVEQARSKKLVKDRLCIVDATHVAAKVNTYRMNAEKKDNDSSDDPPSRIDPDARHGYKTKNKPFFGYKVAIGMDKSSSIITRVTATPGNEHDSTHFAVVADPAAKAVTADKGYDTPDNFTVLKKRKQRAAIMVKRRKGKQRGHINARYPQRKDYQFYYRLKSCRPLVEKIFGTAKQWYGLARAKYYGLKKMTIQAILTMMAINFKRIITLETCLQTSNN